MTSPSTTHDDATLPRLQPDSVGLCRRALHRGQRLLHLIEPWGQAAVLLAMRLVYGWFFVQAGGGKLMNLERTSGFFESLGLPAPGGMAGLVGATELVGGLLLALGLGTRFAATALAVVMLAAVGAAHADEAWVSLTAFTEQAPYPFLVATLVLSAFGAGRLSSDALLRAWAAGRLSCRCAASTDDRGGP